MHYQGKDSPKKKLQKKLQATCIFVLRVRFFMKNTLISVKFISFSRKFQDDFFKDEFNKDGLKG